MERFLLFVALGFGIAHGQVPPATGSLTGKVIDATTKAGIRKATVYAMVQAPPPVPGEGVRFAQPTMYSAVTDDGGVYRFAGLPPGPISLRGEKAGYLQPMAAPQARNVVKAGEEVTGADLVMVKQAIIAGRVTDLDGEPVEQASVMAIPARRSRMSRGGAMGQSTTDDRGEFRIPRLSAGRYKLLASKPANNFATAAPAAAGVPVMLNAPTFFPSVLDPASASEIAVGSGEERTGAEIRLQQTVAVRVAGRVTGEGDLPMVSVALQPIGAQSQGLPRGFGGMMNHRNVMAGPDGHFVFPSVIPGEYFAHANAHRAGGSTPLSGVAKLRVGQADVDQFVIHLQPLARITGKVMAEGSAPLPFPQINVSLASVEPGFPGGGGGSVKTDGTFVFENLQRTRLRVNPIAPRGWYLKSVSVGGQPQPGLEFDLSAGDASIELLYSDKPGAVEVSVEGLTAESPFSLAMALPEAGVGLPPVTNFYKSVPVHAGRIVSRIEDIPPGNYYIVVGQPGLVEALNDAAVWERVKSKAVAVKVEEGVTVQAAPRLMIESDVEEK